ncbi:MAG TPA: choice-of-anchor D domain-containing protein, partial [Candidatus Kapabacteria bacterium]|nr:choice-of-anchor D domain-containing protein [Candidatus Kapabacteria bacterium]
MRGLRFNLLLALMALAMSSSTATAALTDYLFSVSSGSALTPSSWTSVWSGSAGSRGSYAGATRTINLPFNVLFNNASYSQITLSSYGLIAFGSTVNSSYSNTLAGTGNPVITAFWDNIYIGGGAPSPGCSYSPSIRYGTTGSSPSRVLVIDYNKVSRGYCDGCQYGPMFIDFQVRIYEGSNRIEFQYSNMSATWPTCAQNYWGSGSTSTSGSIGLAAGTSDFISVTPSGSSASINRSTANNSVNLASTTITSGTIYTFTPCNVDVIGNVAQGGTATMTSGDILLSTKSVERGASATYQPFTMSLVAGSCATRNMTVTLAGAHAGDYTVSPIGAVNLAAGQTIQFSVTFTPQSIGQRTATLTINDPLGAPRVYTLRATGLPRISWTPDLAQGGTPTLTSGDTLLKDIIVLRLNPRDFTPITLRNFSANGAIPPAVITYSIDSAGGLSTQYTLQTPSTVSLGAGQSHTPIIRFRGTGLGVQHATLTINADGEIRSFPLKAISGAPGIAITALGVTADPGNPVFHQTYSCVGEQTTVIPLLVNNPGQFPLIVSSIELYRTDSTDQQGTPSFPLIRDAQGRVVAMTDYQISETPGVAPIGVNPPVPVPFTIDPGQTRTLYATFIGQFPGKRFGRVYIRSNAQNAFGTDTTLNGAPNSVMGLLTFDLVGRAIGSQLAANATGLPMKTVSFPGTRIGDTAVMSFTIANSGACDLRINRNKLRISSGDVNEFTLMTSLRRATLDAATGDYVLAPGLVDTLTVRFTPSRSGTRMATLWIQTNDSSLTRPGLVERGSYYLDLSGRGLAGLDAQDLVLDPVVIGSSVTGTARLENSQTASVGIASIAFVGDDAAEFSEDATTPWPARPFTVLPGDKLELGV